ncbi:MAG: aldo/keto reductase [Deltaproteobacteria bacterium]|nr:aldo/keto reductase [Deltaproteobacteria bacterium]
MEYTTLGRTGLKVSVGGLGCGGPSRLGLRANKSAKEVVALVRQAVDMGVNFLDTAEVYGTEEVVGKALEAIPRDRVVISTKKAFPLSDPANPAGELRKGLEQSLKRLKTDYIDVYHAHGVEPQDYGYVSDRLVPEMLKLKKEGKIRFLGITEAFVEDMGHRMLQQALKEGYWDVIMVGYNMLNQSARNRILPETLGENVGTLVMFAVRRALSRPERLREVWADLLRKGLVAGDAGNPEDPLNFLLRDGKASTIVDAAYRFCRHEPGVHVVLSGTGSADHLKANIESLTKPPLPESVTARLREIFGKIDCITGN